MRFCLIPINHRGNIIPQWQEAFKPISPSKGLNRNFQILFKINGIANMEPIHSKPLIRLKGPLGIQYLTKAGIKIGKLLVGSFGIFKVPGASK